MDICNQALRYTPAILTWGGGDLAVNCFNAGLAVDCFNAGQSPASWHICADVSSSSWQRSNDGAQAGAGATHIDGKDMRRFRIVHATPVNIYGIVSAERGQKVAISYINSLWNFVSIGQNMVQLGAGEVVTARCTRCMHCYGFQDLRPPNCCDRCQYAKHA